METTKTMTSVLWGKLVEYVDARTVKQMVRDFALSGLVAFFAGYCVNARLTDAAVRWHQGTIPLLVLLLAAAVHAKELALTVWNLTLDALPERAEPTEDTIEGIPTVELLDHLFTAKSFKRDDIESKFRVPRYKVSALTKKFKELGVLVSGENNASVLNPEFSRQDLASILRDASSADDLEPLFRKDELGYTSRPSMPDIEKRAADTPPPRAPNFVTRISAAASGAARVQA